MSCFYRSLSRLPTIACILCATSSTTAAQDAGTSCDQERDAARARITQLEERNRDLGQRAVGLEGRLATAEAELDRATKNLEARTGELAEAQQRIKAHESQLAQAEKELAQIQNDLEAAQKAQSETEDRVHELKQKELTLRWQIAGLKKTEDGEAATRINQLTQQLDETRESKLAAEQDLVDLTKSVGELSQRARERDEIKRRLARERARNQEIIRAFGRYQKRFDSLTLVIVVAFALMVVVLAFRAFRGWKTHVKRTGGALSDRATDPIRKAALDEFIHQHALVEVLRPTLSITTGVGVVGVSALVLIAVHGLYGVYPTEDVLHQLLNGPLWQVVVGLFVPVGALGTLYIATQTKLRESIALCHTLGLFVSPEGSPPPGPREPTPEAEPEKA